MRSSTEILKETTTPCGHYHGIDPRGASPFQNIQPSTCCCGNRVASFCWKGQWEGAGDVEECPLHLFTYKLRWIPTPSGPEVGSPCPGTSKLHRCRKAIPVVNQPQGTQAFNLETHCVDLKKHLILNFKSEVFIWEEGYQNQYWKVSLSCEELILLPCWSRSGLNPIRLVSTISQPLFRFRCLMTRGSPISKQKCAAEPPSIRYSNMSPHHCQR